MTITDNTDTPVPRRARAHLTPAEYQAICIAAVDVNFGDGSRSKHIDALHSANGLNRRTTGALLNNFRCLLQGRTFKTPMRGIGLEIFVDAIVARQGSVVIPNILSAIDGYLQYMENRSGTRSVALRSVADGVRREWEKEHSLRVLAEQLGRDAMTVNNPVTSEILREIWVRGSQHAAFRRALLRRWGNSCSVHGAHCNGQLRASHIVAWSLDVSLRGEVNNGLLLSVPLDSLFDRGLISFDDFGELIRADKLDNDTAQHFGIRPGLRIAWQHLSEEAKTALRENLSRHRARFRI